MKIVKWIVLVVVLLLLVGGLIFYFTVNGMIRSTVQTQATSSMDLKTTLGSASLSLFGKRLALDNLQIASPQGFSAPNLLDVGRTVVKVNIGQLRSEPIHIAQIIIRQPKLVIEQSGGKLNVQAAMDQMPKSQTEPMKLIIDKLQITGATVALRPGLPGLAQELSIPLPTIDMENIGSAQGNQNGVAIKQVVMQVLTTMADKAKESDKIPADLKQWMNLNVDQLTAQVGAEINKRLGEKLPGDVGKVIGNVIKNPNEAAKDPSKAIEQGLKGFLGGQEKKAPATQP